MSRIDKIIFKAIFPPFFLAISVLTFIVFVHDISRVSELLVTRNASMNTILIIAGTILPGILVFTLPLSYLIGILIGLSGLSGESQVVALRSCGVPARALLKPIVVLGIGVGGLTGLFSTVILPRTNDLLGMVKERISLKQATSQIQARVFNEDFPNLVFYMDDQAPDRQHWFRVFLVDSTDPKAPKTVLARDGAWISSSDGMRLQLHLEQGTVYEVDPGDASKDNVSIFAATDIPIEINHGDPAAAAARPQKASEQRMSDLLRSRPDNSSEQNLEQAIEFHRRLAIPFAVFPFALLGLTLGVSTKKGGRTSGFVLSLVLVLVFYTFFFNGLRLASVGKLSPWLGAWGANLILALLGATLLWRAEKSASRLHQYLLGLRWTSKLAPLGHDLHLDSARTLIHHVDQAVVNSTSKIARRGLPKILDLYITRGFFAYFSWSLLVCGSLWIVLTLFDLLDDVIRNRIPIPLIVEYFFFYTPQILMLIIPMAILLAILINFSILEKHSEITAIKSGGWSLYRTALPIFMQGAFFCVGMYVLQDYILPYANIRQDSIRNVIKGRPAQTTLQPQRKWILGHSNRIYNYDYFDGSKNLFVDLNIFELDPQFSRITRRIHAGRGTLDESGRWTLENGWVRDFKENQNSFRKIQKEQFVFSEKPSYFEKEIFQPKESSKMSYLELKDYINYLENSGYNATELSVELNKKISFPISCLVMALLGVPFSFSAGKKGAFFGIAMSLAIAMSYWAVYSVFEQMGAYGMLAPLLAAWAPNILFGAAGLSLLFTIRT